MWVPGYLREILVRCSFTNFDYILEKYSKKSEEKIVDGNITLRKLANQEHTKELARVRMMDHAANYNTLSLDFEHKKIQALVPIYAKYLCDWLAMEGKFDFEYLKCNTISEHEIQYVCSGFTKELVEIAEFYEELSDTDKSVWKKYMISRGWVNDLIVTYEKPQHRQDDYKLRIKF